METEVSLFGWVRKYSNQLQLAIILFLSQHQHYTNMTEARQSLLSFYTFQVTSYTVSSFQSKMHNRLT